MKFFGFHRARQYYWKFSVMILQTWKRFIRFYLFNELHKTGNHVMFDAESQVDRRKYTCTDETNFPQDKLKIKYYTFCGF
jgi:hypothetical protein